MTEHEQKSINVDKRVYTVGEIAEILCISKATAYRLVKEGHFHTVRCGKSIRIPKQAFEKWMEQLQQ